MLEGANTQENHINPDEYAWCGKDNTIISQLGSLDEWEVRAGIKETAVAQVEPASC